eukprot:CAMPEP_0177743554 /NCGR_PEP_ID=MMETSP0484_2-20121128/29256_1 /TAXON_ID=354590 /ORGANISM="Rhodomonas lens, Strain RHODO" /LENGTH=524 /DNA_ID=CAMNT_0019257961 /DNA_START=8 /DNA_END=1583 /DNA_ORIENTATION=+
MGPASSTNREGLRRGGQGQLSVKILLCSVMLLICQGGMGFVLSVGQHAVRSAGAGSKISALHPLSLRGGSLDKSRPWRSIPLEEGESSILFNSRSPDSPITMTATNWESKTGDEQLLNSEYPDPHFFSASLAAADPEIAAAMDRELLRQQDQLEMIASENIVSKAVMQAQGSVMTNKYAEGYPGRRYYGGCTEVDAAERLALARVKELFNCSWANVQPHSGAQANQAVMLALCAPGDTVLGMALAAGGHLTHGAAPNLSGKWFNDPAVGLGAQADAIVAGGSAYARTIDFARFRQIADSVGAHLLVDMAHFSGLVAGHAYPSPLPHAHVVTTTTHKVLRGPRGGLVLSNDEELGKKINSAVRPMMHTIAAKAVAFKEALKPSYRQYAAAVVSNAQELAAVLLDGGVDIVSGGTDSHLILVDLRPKRLTGKVAEAALERAGITCNKNAVPFDPEKPFVTSGIRLGTPVLTTRGMGTQELRQVGTLILEVLDGLVANGPDGNGEVEGRVRDRVRLLCERFPIYHDM